MSKHDVELITGFRLSPDMLVQIEGLVIEHLDERIQRIVEECVERCLDRRLRESTEARVIPIEEAMPIVEEFVRKQLETSNEVYPSDVAEELGLDYNLVLQVFERLVKEEKLRRG